MATISTTEARSRFTKMLIAVMKERPKVYSFLRSFFPTVEAATKYISIEVMRGTEYVAVDVTRGDEGNRNTFKNSTEKVIEPPYYREWFDITQLDLYDRLFGSTGIEEGILTQLLAAAAEKLGILIDKIERAYELQCAQVFQTGVLTLQADTNIDFKRKASSMVDLTSSTGYWTTNTVNPEDAFITGGNFLRQEGKIQGGILNAICGETAWSALKNNAIFQKQADIRNFNLHTLTTPQATATGGVPLGQITAGNYLINCWGYSEVYQNANGTFSKYVEDENVILLPERPNLKLAFAAVPQLIHEQNPTVQKGAYLIGEMMDQYNAVHKYDVKSAGVAVPVAVDQIYTMKVRAAAGES